MGQVPLVSATPRFAVGDVVVWLEGLHYCHVGGPCVSGGKLVVQGSGRDDWVVVKYLGTKQALVFCTDETRKRLLRILAQNFALRNSASAGAQPVAIHELLVRHYSGSDRQAGCRLNLAVLQLVHRALQRAAGVAPTAAR
jgi:hypothetical protein